MDGKDASGLERASNRHCIYRKLQSAVDLSRSDSPARRRICRILYGYYPSDEVIKDKLQLKPAMTLKTKVAHIKELKEDTGISYGLKYKTSKLERIITIPIGYADGFTRMQNNPKVSINNEIFDVVGRICMDQCMVRIDKDIDIKIGDEVIIFGESNINADNIAKDLGTINYEIVCMVSRRVDRIYKERNVILQADSYLVKLKR